MAARAQARTAFALSASAEGPAVASPFPEVPLDTSPASSHTTAYVALGTGAALVGISFLLDRNADDAYAEYLAETDPARIEDAYRRTVLNDRLSSASLLTGEGLMVLGVYLRFLQRPVPGRVALVATPARCAVSFRF